MQNTCSKILSSYMVPIRNTNFFRGKENDRDNYLEIQKLKTNIPEISIYAKAE